jgi:Ca2+-binding EF-hand superfamily protein
MDDSGDGQLDEFEFKKGIHDYGIEADPKDIAGLFKALDTDRSGSISYNEFIYAIKGPMNQFRQDIVLKAFKQLDRTGDGVLTVDDIKGVYSAAKHPDVLSGKRTEDEILNEFLETFESHHNMINGT